MTFKSDFSAILKAAEQSKNGTYAKKEKDLTLWTPTWDAGKTSATATIRFLPETQEGKLPWAHYFFHNFQRMINGKKRFYNEKCLSTINPDDYESDPVNAYRKAVFDSMDKESAKKVCEGTQRQEKYLYNILVIKDELAPDNEGKVFKFAAGKTVHGMIMDKVKPEFVDEDTVTFNPFDLQEGANFKIRLYMKEKMPQWDKCEFSKQSAIVKSEAQAEQLQKMCHDIYADVTPDKFGDPQEMYKKLTWALGLDKKTSDAGKEATTSDDQADDQEPKDEGKFSFAKDDAEPVEPKKTAVKEHDSDDSESDDAYFKKLSEM